jgi:hypothetical protein
MCCSFIPERAIKRYLIMHIKKCVVLGRGGGGGVILKGGGMVSYWDCLRGGGKQV